MTDAAREQQSEAVKACAESVMRDNPDMDKSQAFQVCQAMEDEGQLQAPEEPELAAPDPPAHRFLQADFSGLPAVRRTQENDDVRYENLVLIGAGEWTDATGHTEYYTERALKKIADDPDGMVEDTSVNVNHEYQDQLLQVGHIDRDSITYQNGLLLGDLVIYGDKQAGQDTIADMDRALESDGEHGAGGFSIQIPNGGFTRRYNAERGMYELTEFKLAGGGVVTEGASGPANLDEQLPNRAVALSAEGDDAAVRVLGPGDTTKAAMRQHTGMETVESIDALRELASDTDDLQASYPRTDDGYADTPSHLLADGETVKIDIEGASLSDIKDALGAGEDRDLADGDVAAAIDEYLASDGSPEDGVDEFLQWANANTDVDMDALEAAAADYLAESGAEDLSETPVSEFMAFVNDGGEEPEEPEEPDEGPDMAAVQENLRELRAELDDAYQRIETLEDRPDYGERSESESEEAEPATADVLGGLATDGDWIGR